MTEPCLVFTAGPVSVVIRQPALAVFDAHRQRRCLSREAGGQLFAQVRADAWEITVATGPRSKDRRGRFSFWPHRPSEQEEIHDQHALGRDYVGDWHTHPEDVPRPSCADLTSITAVARRSTHHLPGFLLLLIGRSPFPDGLWASFHAVNGARSDAEGLRMKTITPHISDVSARSHLDDQDRSSSSKA